MDSSLIYYAIIALGLFVGIWMFFVVPSEKRHHERKLKSVRDRLEKRNAAKNGEQFEAPDTSDEDKTRVPDDTQ